MRTRDEIMASVITYGARDGDPIRLAILAALIDIRDQLAEHEANVARCGHGVTGLCMSCVIQNDLLRPAR